MEKYTETAAIEVHEINVNTYEDGLEQLCIASEEDAEINFYMRNPKQFMMMPSVSFINLNSKVSRSAVSIEQLTTEIVNLKLPQEFLIPADEGQDITLEINLYEPMSGREFDVYTVPLHCNTEPPIVLNPTIINNGNSTFVVAFDMPNPEEVAIRHKDISTIEINGKSYPVKVSTVADTEVEGVLLAEYKIEDSHFTRSPKSTYSFINEKDFTPTARTSFYYETDEAYLAGDKEFSVTLKDAAGLSNSTKASTSISKLEKPVLMDMKGSVISEGGLTGIPFDEDTKIGSVTIIPPTQDHHGKAVSGATVYYKVYESNGSGKIYTSGSTATSKTIELPQNTYRVEAYAVLTNYENSATSTVRFRFLNNVLFVEEGGVGDGSEIWPFGSVAEALTSINDPDRRRESKYTIYLKGNLDEAVEIANDLNTDEIILATNPRANQTASVKSIKINDNMPSTFKLDVNKLSINSDSNRGFEIGNNSPVTVTLTNVNISGNYAGAIYISEYSGSPNITCTNVNISGFDQAIILNGADLTFNSGTITGVDGASTYYGIKVTASKFIFNGGTITGYTNGSAIWASGGEAEIKGGTISNNNKGIDVSGTAKVTVSGASIKQNAYGLYYESSEDFIVSGGTIENNTMGIYVNAENFKLKDKPVIQNNQTSGATPVKQNVVLTSGKNIGFEGALVNGCKVGVKTDSDRVPTAIGTQFSFASGYNSTWAAPSKFFTSDDGLSIVRDGSNVAVALTGGSGGFGGDVLDYAFDFAVYEIFGYDVPVVSFYPGQAKKIKIKPTIKNYINDPANPAIIPYSDIQSQITWSVKLLAGEGTAADLTASKEYISGNDYVSFTIPASVTLPYNYKLKIKATYLGVDYTADEIVLTGGRKISDVINCISYLKADGRAGEYSLSIEDDTRLTDATNLTALKNEANSTPTDVKIKLDLSRLDISALQDDMFMGITCMTEISLPGSLTNIGANALKDCSGLTKINYNGTKEQWAGITRIAGWHAGVPSNTKVYQTGTSTCWSMDYVPPLTGGVTILGGPWSVVEDSSIFISGRTGDEFVFSNLWVSDHETTQFEYAVVMGENPSYFDGSTGREPADDENQQYRPVEKINWYMALVYCNRRSMAEGLTPCYIIKKELDPTEDSTNPDEWGNLPTGNNDSRWNAVICNWNANGYRLPTEAEWEYCARGGNLTGEQTQYSGTNNESELRNYAWYSDTSDNITHEVKKKRPNSKGLYDMNGNVWEWCWDFDNTISATTPASGPNGPKNGTENKRVFRGGAYSYDATRCVVSYHGSGVRADAFKSYGIRVVRTLP